MKQEKKNKEGKNEIIQRDKEAKNEEEREKQKE